MKTITISMTEQQAARLQEAATRYQISPEELALRGIEELLERPADELDSLIDYLLDKNAALYRRLA